MTELFSNSMTLLMGFAFGLWPDGSPGKINERLASLLSQHTHALKQYQRSFLLGLQWEIADALKVVADDNTIVAGPPQVKPSEIPEPEAIRALLLHSNQLHFRYLREVLSLTHSVSSDDQALSHELNQIIEKAEIHTHLSQCLDIEDLRRPEKGMLGLEKRRIPSDGDSLRPYQRQRVNRLVLESIFPPQLLKRGQYLSTYGVSRYIANTIQHTHPDLTIEEIHIFAHPCHLAFCTFNTARAVSATPHIFSPQVVECAEAIQSQWGKAVSEKQTRQLPATISLQELPAVNPDAPIRCKVEEHEQYAEEWWDAQSAQVWTRTHQAYATYQNIP